MASLNRRSAIRTLLLSAGAWPTLSRGQESGLVFRSGVSLVRVDAAVIGARGLPIPGLQQADFRVLDNGTEVPVSAFSFEEEPVDLILLFDLSAAMKARLLRVVRAVELGFHELKQGDRVCVMAFRSELSEIAPFTSDLDAVNRTILLQVLPLRFGGKTDPENAAREAAGRFRREPKTHRRRALLLITDKAGAGARPPAETVRALWEADAVLGILELGNAPETRISPPANTSLAGQTGGATVIAGEPGPSFQQALRLLRRRYTLYYSSPGGAPGTEHRVQVSLSREAGARFPDALVTSRTGYLVAVAP